jgi:hypothetical protein
MNDDRDEIPLTDEPGELPQTVAGFSDRRVALVQNAIRDWTHQLIDLGGRNNLLHYRDLRASTLDLTVADRGALANLLQGKTVRLASMFKDTELSGALKRARSIHKKAVENFEERGLDTLYVACGLATWNNIRGAWDPAAPVLFRAAVLRPVGAAQDEFELSLVDEMEVNPSLLQVLKVDFECEPDPEELLDRIDGAIDEPWELQAAYDWLAEHAALVPGFSVEPRIVLANFAYAKLPMVRDLENAFDELVGHELIAAIAATSKLATRFARRTRLQSPCRGQIKRHRRMSSSCSTQIPVRAMRSTLSFRARA